MKALTLWQPWASLWAIGAKRYETRSWYTSYRGPIAIHAATKKPSSIWEAIGGIIDEVRLALGIIDPDELPRGAIIATGELVGCWEIHNSHSRGSSGQDVFIDKYNPDDINGMTWISDEEQSFGDFSAERYAWEIANIKVLDKPIPARGKQGLWNWDATPNIIEPDNKQGSAVLNLQAVKIDSQNPPYGIQTC